MRTRIVTGCVMALAAMAGVAGCSSTQIKDASQGVHKAAESLGMVMRRVADKADEKGSAQVAFTVSVHGRGGTMVGTYAWGSGPGAGIDVWTDTAALGFQRLHAAKSTEVRFVGGAYYYAVDPQPRGPLKGKHWMKVDASAVMGGGSQQLSEGLQQNPTSGLQQLAVADDVTKVGTQTVDGKQTTHYTGTFSRDDLAAYNKLFAKDRPSPVQQMLGGQNSMRLDVWVDDQDMPVRLSEDFGVSKITIDFKSFGGTRHIQVPPVADTGDISAAVKARRRQGA